MTQPMTVEQYREAQAAEYGRFIATETIYINGARAFNAGDAVPASHVESGVVNKNQVEQVATKTEAKAAASTTEKG